ncbi:MAG: hypothetical protein KatS3mg053_2893 [Candidatus Roseilinea sp.]|nr:MAG: hypothetical protein KatS3mg053_2893 [Candidatus Roseilinea sp.]
MLPTVWIGVFSTRKLALIETSRILRHTEL